MVDAQTLGEWGAVFEIALGILLLVGMLLVRRGHVRAHMIVQTSVVLVNLPFVLATMVPLYVAYVLPDLPGELFEPSYLAPTVMLFAGGIAEGLGVYILLVAGTNWIPERFRFRKFKRWMRTELALWWSVIIAGLSTYYLWYFANGLS